MWRKDGDHRTRVGVGDASDDARVGGLELVNGLVGGDDGREAGDRAVVHDLVELFLGPWRCRLRAEVIEDQQAGVAHLFEEFVVADFLTRREGCAEVVEKVGHDGEEDGSAAAEGAIGDGRREVSFAAAVGALEDEPAGGLIRIGHGGPERAIERLTLFRAEARATEVEVAELHLGEAFAGHAADLAIATGGSALEDVDGREAFVDEACGKALVELLGADTAREDGGQFGVVAMVEDLEEFLACPRGAGGRVDIVEEEEGDVLHLFEELFVAHLLVGGVVACAEVVEQVGNNHEEGGFSKFDAGIGNRRGEVCLAAATATAEDDPARGVGGIGERGVVGGAEP